MIQFPKNFQIQARVDLDEAARNCYKKIKILADEHGVKNIQNPVQKAQMKPERLGQNAGTYVLTQI